MARQLYYITNVFYLIKNSRMHSDGFLQIYLEIMYRLIPHLKLKRPRVADLY